VQRDLPQAPQPAPPAAAGHQDHDARAFGRDRHVPITNRYRG